MVNKTAYYDDVLMMIFLGVFGGGIRVFGWGIRVLLYFPGCFNRSRDPLAPYGNFGIYATDKIVSCRSFILLHSRLMVAWCSYRAP